MQIVGKQGRLLRDKVVAAPGAGELIRRKVQWVEKHKVQQERAEESVTAKSIDSALGNEDYVIDRMVDH